MSNKPEIQVNVEQQSIAFVWPEQRAEFSYQRLREICPCAFCRSKRIQQIPLTADPAVYVTEINHQGYGVQLCFSDGHDKGIFPWQYLQQVSSP